VTGSDLIVLAPWVVLGAAVGAICGRLLTARSGGPRRRARRRPGRPGLPWGYSGAPRTRDPGSSAPDRVPGPGRPGAAP
jgi:hypothetical protein